jgi:hypothetical protein
MKVQIDNKIVTLVLIPKEVHESNKIVYHELNENGQPYREHSFRIDWLQMDGSFWTNGHHYKTGSMVGKVCDLEDCDRCQGKTIQILTG